MNGTGGVLVIGEALVDVVHPADGGPPAEHVGGSPANVAMGLARLGHTTHLATHVGTDARGDRIAQALSDAGARLAPGSRTADHTPTASATLDESGAATYDFDLDWRHDTAAVDELLAGDPTIDHVHTGSIAATLEPGGSALLEHLADLRNRCTVSYDPNARPGIMGDREAARERVEAFVALADVVKCSDEDLAWLYPESSTDEATEHLLRQGPSLVVVTRGSSGASARWLDARGGTAGLGLPAEPVAVVDTVGAGDSFMAGLLSGLLGAGLLGRPSPGPSQGGPPHRTAGRWNAIAVAPALARGLATAAWTVQRAGAGGPTHDQVG